MVFFGITPVFIKVISNKKNCISKRDVKFPSIFGKKKKEKNILIISKSYCLYKNVFFHATNKLEATSIENELGTKAKVIIASNLPRLISNRKHKNTVKNERVLNLVSIARISKEKGTLTALEGILACTNIKEVKINFHLYGTIYDVHYWEQCKAIIKLLPRHVEVVYKGNLASEKVPSTIQNYDFLLMPSEGENFGHSILEAFSVGTPVIISDNTPWRNLEEKQIGWDVSLKKSINLQHVIDVAINMEQNEYNRWSLNAFNFALDFCNNKEIINANRGLFD